MRFVGRRRGSSVTSVTDLAKFLTCPYLFLREKVVGKRKTAAMKRGLELHRERYLLHREGAVEMDIEEAVEASWRGKVIGVEVWVDDGEVGGFVDRVEVEEGRARVVEYKSTPRSASWKASKLQALIYGAILQRYVDYVVVEVRTFEEEVFFRRQIDGAVLEAYEKGKEAFRRSIDAGVFPPLPGPHCRHCPLRKSCPLFKGSSLLFMGVSEVAGDGRVQL